MEEFVAFLDMIAHAPQNENSIYFSEFKIINA